MNTHFEKLLQNIPDYDTFFTAAELDERSQQLAKAYPDVVSVFPMGETKEGKTLLCLKIAGGPTNALMFGCPHPNEPIGTMMLEYLTEQLAQDKALRDALGYTWYIVKAWDRDGLELNEGWLKGPYTVFNYSRNFFRPAGHKQVDWTFPITYKTYSFNEPIPETTAMMALIDEIKPEFIYSLHNAGFGGTYWYLSDPQPEATYQALHAASAKVDIPLHLGEPEAPYIKPYYDAIYPMLGLGSEYDFIKDYSDKDPNDVLNIGTNSAEYAHERYGSNTLVTELPYFYDRKIADQSETTRLRKEVVLEKLDQGDESDAYVRDMLKKTAGLVAEANPFRTALVAFSKGDYSESMRAQVEKDAQFSRPATVAEVFDNITMSKFYKSLSYGMVIRMLETTLAEKTAELSEDETALLNTLLTVATLEHRELTTQLEAELDYEVIPIKKLISIQLESALIICEALKTKREAV